MEDAAENAEDAIWKEISAEGKSLILVARRIQKEQWQLAVENEHGISSVWLESFSTPLQAIDAGIRAVKSEGIESFVSTEGFEYLHD